MTCEEFVDAMLDYVGEELPAEQVEAIKTHLCGCNSCGTSEVHYRFTIRMTRTLSQYEPLPPDFEARLRAAVAAEAEELRG